MQWEIMINLLWGEIVPSAQDDLGNYLKKKKKTYWNEATLWKGFFFLTVETIKDKQQRHKNKNTMI